MHSDLYSPAPWVTLPVEIQDEIILLAAETSPPLLGSTDEHELGWRALILVCKGWQDINMKNKSLWAAIHAQDPAIMSAALSRAEAHHLVYIHTFNNVRCVPTLDRRVEDMAYRQFDPSRYTYIEVDRLFDAAHSHLQKLCTMEAPKLETLILTEHHRFGSSFPR